MTNTFSCRVQYLDDSNPFVTSNFPEPTRPPTFAFLTNVSLNNQIASIHATLKAPLKVRSHSQHWLKWLSNRVPVLLSTFSPNANPLILCLFSIDRGLHAANLSPERLRCRVRRLFGSGPIARRTVRRLRCH